MFTSLMGTDTAITEQVPESSLPWIWVGFVFAVMFFVIEILFMSLDLDERRVDLSLRLIVVVGFFYWLFCVYRIHKILAELTRKRYPISPVASALKHFIPFYNLYWLFAWPAELSDYLNRRGRVRVISGYVIGAMLLLSLLLRRFDGGISIAFLFGVTMFLSSKLKEHVKAMTGVRPNQLPPLPDPEIFSRPIETTSKPPETVARSRGRIIT